MAALPFGKRSLTVRRGGEVVQRETTEASGLQSGPPETSGERKGPREEFLEGRRHEQPYRVRRMPEMVVGDRGKWAQLDYMERLLVSTPPLSLSSLPTPAQLWRKRKSIQSEGVRMECKRRVSARDDYRSNVHEHLAHLHRKQRLFDLDSGLLGVSAQEVPSSPHHAELPVEETSLTLHGRTPLKDHPYTVEGGGQWATGGGDQPSLFSLDEEGEQELEDSELERQFGMSHAMQLHSEPGIEQDLNSCATTEGGVRGIALSHEEGENAGGSRPGFRPAGGALERMWLAHSLSSSRYRVDGRGARREGGGASRCGGLKINPVEGYLEGVPFNRGAAVESQCVPVDQNYQGFSELLSCHPHHESIPSLLPPGGPRRLLPLGTRRDPEQQEQSTLDHMMDLCFNPQTLALRNHFPREE